MEVCVINMMTFIHGLMTTLCISINPNKKNHNALQPATEIHKGAPDLINGYPDFHYHLWYKNCASTAYLSASNSDQPKTCVLCLQSVTGGWSLLLCFLQTSFTIFSYMFLSYSVAALPWNAEYSMVFTDFDWSVAYNRKYFFDIYCKKN